VIRLEQMRLDRRLTPEQLAEEAGVSARTIRRIEAVELAPRDATVWKLADFFDVPPSVLLMPAIAPVEDAA
jgi:transcriptional regulator with XRE-family HTH domain